MNRVSSSVEMADVSIVDGGAMGRMTVQMAKMKKDVTQTQVNKVNFNKVLCWVGFEPLISGKSDCPS